MADLQQQKDGVAGIRAKKKYTTKQKLKQNDNNTTEDVWYSSLQNTYAGEALCWPSHTLNAQAKNPTIPTVWTLGTARFCVPDRSPCTHNGIKHACCFSFRLAPAPSAPHGGYLCISSC